MGRGSAIVECLRVFRCSAQPGYALDARLRDADQVSGRGLLEECLRP